MTTPNWYVGRETYKDLLLAAWEERESGEYTPSGLSGRYNHPADIATSLTLFIEDFTATWVALGKAGLIAGILDKVEPEA
jgi:hypothetical protein